MDPRIPSVQVECELCGHDFGVMMVPQLWEMRRRYYREWTGQEPPP